MIKEIFKLSILDPEPAYFIYKDLESTIGYLTNKRFVNVLSMIYFGVLVIRIRILIFIFLMKKFLARKKNAIRNTKCPS